MGEPSGSVLSHDFYLDLGKVTTPFGRQFIKIYPEDMYSLSYGKPHLNKKQENNDAPKKSTRSMFTSIAIREIQSKTTMRCTVQEELKQKMVKTPDVGEAEKENWIFTCCQRGEKW